MNYQDLTVKELRALLRSRKIAGRSKATTKKEMIALLMECDRLSAEERPATGENFIASPPAPPAPMADPEPEPEYKDEDNYDLNERCSACGYTLSPPDPDGGEFYPYCLVCQVREMEDMEPGAGAKFMGDVMGFPEGDVEEVLSSDWLPEDWTPLSTPEPEPRIRAP